MDKSQMDWHIQAVSAWQSANKNLKNFARCCYHVSDEGTKALAQDCGCSHDTVNNYRNAYDLYLQVGGDANELVRKQWDSAAIALWVKAAQLQGRLELTTAQTYEYLETAIDHHMTRESFAAHVDNKENDTPQWIRRLKSAIRFLTPSKNDFKSEMPPQVQSRYDKAVAVFVAELEAIAQVEISV